jgi:Photoprotection regulator fluorescence recovery protein
LVREAKEISARVEEASELWNFEHWLTQRRLDIERKYDYRYSVLPFVFATLVKGGRISENDLRGGGVAFPDKLHGGLIGTAAQCSPSSLRSS